MLNAVVKANKNVVATDLDDEMVLLDPKTQQMVSLNETGRFVCLALPKRLTDLGKSVAEAFEVSEEDARAAVQALLDELAEAKLIELTG